MNILVVDDDLIICKGISKIISSYNENWKVTAEAPNGKIAYELYLEHPDIDLIITDIRMPVMNGLELIKNIRKDNRNVRIIVLSGFDDYKYVRDAFIGGAVDYLLKPIDKSKLISLVGKVEQLYSEDVKIENDRRLNHRIMITDILGRIYTENNPPDKELLQAADSMKMPFNSMPYFVIITRVDNLYKEKFDKAIYEEHLNKYEQGIFEFFEENKEYQLFQYSNKKEIISLIFIKQKSASAALPQKLSEKIYAGDEAEKTYTMGISGVHRSIYEAYPSYKEAVEAADARFYMGKSRIIFYKDIENKFIEIQYNLQPHVELIANYLELCDYINAKNEMDIIFLDLSFSRPAVFRKYIGDFMEMLFIRTKDFENAVICNDHDYTFNIGFMNTYNELKSYMHSIIKSAIDYIRSEREKRSKKRIEMVKLYINDHYNEQITLNDVADYVGLNSSYLSNLFKEEEGENFSDFLLNKRIGIAKSLLKNPKYKVYEIGIMVGYEDAVSFERAFKKKINMSPKEYRNFVS